MTRRFDSRPQRAARKLLDAARNGAQVSEAEITQALIDGGDMEDPLVTEPMKRIITPVGAWERSGAALMRPASWLGHLEP